MHNFTIYRFGTENFVILTNNIEPTASADGSKRLISSVDEELFLNQVTGDERFNSPTSCALKKNNTKRSQLLRLHGFLQ